MPAARLRNVGNGRLGRGLRRRDKTPPKWVRVVLANRRRTAETPNLAVRRQSIGWMTVEKVPLAWLSFPDDVLNAGEVRILQDAVGKTGHGEHGCRMSTKPAARSPRAKVGYSTATAWAATGRAAEVLERVYGGDGVRGRCRRWSRVARIEAAS